MSDTPRSDILNEDYGSPSVNECMDLCRTLERELNVERVQSQRLREALAKALSEFCAIQNIIDFPSDHWSHEATRILANKAPEPSSDPCQLGSIPREDVLPLVKEIKQLHYEIHMQGLAVRKSQALKTFTAKYGEVKG